MLCMSKIIFDTLYTFKWSVHFLSTHQTLFKYAIFLIFSPFPLVTFLCVNCYSSHSIDSSRLVKFWLNAIWIMNPLQVHAKLKCGPLGCASQTYMKHQVCSEGTLFRLIMPLGKSRTSLLLNVGIMCHVLLPPHESWSVYF